MSERNVNFGGKKKIKNVIFTKKSNQDRRHWCQ